VTDDIAAPAPASGIWRRLWRFIQACELSSAEYQDLRIDALERRVAGLQKALQERSVAPAVAFQENSRGAPSVAIGPDVRGPQQRSI
jgi:hypothetical protein